MVLLILISKWKEKGGSYLPFAGIPTLSILLGLELVRLLPCFLLSCLYILGTALLSLSLSLSTLSLSLYVLICETKTRIHGEVVLSAQPRWLSHGTAPDSNLSHVGLSHYAPSILCFSFHLT